MLPELTSQKVAIPAALFLALSPGVLLTTSGRSVKFMNGQTGQMAVAFHALVFFLVYSLIARALGLVLTKTDLLVTTTLFLRTQPRYASFVTPWIGWCLREWPDQCRSCVDAHGCLRDRFRVTSQAISYFLLNRRMKYLVLGPASMGIYAFLGRLKSMEESLGTVKEISGSSAGSILALFWAIDMSIDDMIEISLNVDLSDFVKLNIGTFFNKFGFVENRTDTR